VLLAAGCATLPPPEPEEVRTEALGAEALPDSWATGATTAAAIEDGWLATFGDPQLEALVIEALANNPDLRIAASRLERSAAYIGVARSALYPMVAVKGQGSTKLGDSLDSGGLNGVVVGASWELDLWGRVRYGRDAAVESFIADQYDYAWARHSIAAATATAWFLSTETLLEKRAAETMVKDSEDLLELAKTRMRVGVADERDVVAAEASITAYQDALLKLTLAHESALRALEVLIGRYPGADIQPRTDLPAIPGAVPAGIPVNALERRPDIYAAERRVAEAFNRVGEARAAQLPTIRLTASGGYADSEIVELVPSFDNPFGSIGASLLAPLFLGGQLAAQVDVRTAEQRMAIAEYAGAALAALYEVESALAAEVNLRDRETILQTNVAQNERALELEKIAFRVGKSDMRRVLGQQLALNGARMALIRVQSEQLIQRVNLHLALGGSFEVVPEAPENPAQTETTENPG
jgi:outer membrane protein, multidrug efflux system